MGKKAASVFKVLILSYVVTGVLLLLAALLMYKLRLGEGQMRIFVMVIYGISTIVAGLAYGKVKQGKGVLNGAMIGAVYVGFLTLVSLIINKGIYDDIKKAVISFIICLLGGILGGIMS